MSLMQKFATAGLAGVVALALSGAAMAVPKVGEPAPDFTAPGAGGKPVKLSAYKGKYVVLEWSNEGCPFVQKHYKSGNMQTLQKTYTGKGVAWITVFSSRPQAQGHVDAEGANKFQQDYKTSATAMVLDETGKLGRLYDAKTTPNMFVVDPTGKLIYSGAIDDKPGTDPADIASSKNLVQLALDEAMAGKPVSTPSTAPYGCSIKY
jgi:alkyl hydroperoxide reductase subunit AhpC